MVTNCLANTGGPSWFLGAVALLLVVLGAFLVARSSGVG